jgi:hypothetical protein
MLKTKNLLKLTFIIPAIAGLSLMAFAPAINVSEEPQNENVVTVDKSVHDFGTIGENAGDVSAVFTITNNTDAPIVLTNVKATCGCTTPKWTKEPIEPGKTGEVTATYSPKGRPGPFDKTVTITTNGEPTELKVHIKGTVE